MSIAIAQPSERELYHYLNGDIIEKSLNRLSNKLGGDEEIFWEIVRVSKGDTEAPKTLKIGSKCFDTLKLCEGLLSAILLHSLNGRPVSRDIKAARIFMENIDKGGENATENSGINTF